MSQNIKMLSAVGVVALTLGGALLGTACGGEPETAAASEAPVAQAQQAVDNDNWDLVWSDEFNGDGLNMNNWSYDNDAHFNNELQQYTENGVDVSGGSLKITVRHHNANGHDYTSGRIKSKNKREFDHGRVEARIKLPVGPGLWPAFWMLGANDSEAVWPKCGEIDIMENVGYGGWTSGTLHGPGYSGANGLTGQFNPDGPVSQFHVYRADYSDTGVKWYIDGELVKSLSRDQINNHGPYVFDHNFYILFNMAIGGDYPAGLNHVGSPGSPNYGLPQSTASLVDKDPQTMEVDWVRVYHKQ